ncbi:MAG: acetyl-CoA carboxylase biotin carboxyl carrier protein subunit [Desulfobacterales bacterium]|nr:acetyl-CoA carboxylase biotin carboxyl carrier protein subunit [Desulfobacterales bacterium]
MKRRIDLLDNHYTVTILRSPRQTHMTVNTEAPQSVAITAVTNTKYLIHMGENRVPVQMAVKGNMTYIRAFDRTFALGIVNPVEQAAQETGRSSSTICAPMPGMVVEIMAAAGDRVAKGQPLMTIESMKILTVLTAPKDGDIARILITPGDSFDKNSVLITLSKTKEM